jgi:hypothetical protein
MDNSMEPSKTFKTLMMAEIYEERDSDGETNPYEIDEDI